MRAIHRTNSKGDERHNGSYAPETLAEKRAVEADEAHEDRLAELRKKASYALGSAGEVPIEKLLSVTITQVGLKGFFWKLPDQHIPTFQPWGRATRLENERVFNAAT